MIWRIFLPGTAVLGVLVLASCAGSGAEPMVEPVIIAEEAPTGSIAEEPAAIEEEMAIPDQATGAIISGPSDLPYATVTAFFGTDRNLTGSNDPGEMFGGERTVPVKLSYGAVAVSIPRDHRMGELESPGWLRRVTLGEDPERHVVLLDVELIEKQPFLAELRAAAADSGSAFVFIHGYNVTFEDAARRTAQIAYDIGFEGAPIFYSWPSRGSTANYTRDENTIEWSRVPIRNFLRDVADTLEGQRIHVIAHSMGNRAVTRALVELYRENPEYRDAFTEVILAAPDIDAQVFLRDIAPMLANSARPVTLYMSSRDKALLASREVHGDTRIGDAGNGIVAISGFEVIDASNVETDFLAHSYFANATSVISDLLELIREGKRALERSFLEPVAGPDQGIWRVRR